MAHLNSPLMLFYFVYLLSSAFKVNAHQYWFPPQAPGVAFGLTPDYGQLGYKDHPSIKRKNKTTATIQESSTLCRWLSPALDVLPSALGLDVDICRHPDVNSVKALLQTLKRAVESYLGTNSCYVAISFDHVQKSWDQHTYEESVVQQALEALGVRKVLGFIQAAKCEILAREARGYDYDDVPGSYVFQEPRSVLAIGYSLHWYNVGMYIIDEGIVDPVDGTVGGPKVEMGGQLQALKESLEHLFAEPPPGFHLPKDIHQLSVYGDDAQNGLLHHLLESFLGTDLVRNANISTSVFDGVAYTAWGAHDYMNQVQI